MNELSIKKTRGFTLIEMILAIGMMLIVTGAVVQVSRFSDTHKNLTLASGEFLAVVRTAQAGSLAIFNPEDEHVCGYGVYVLTPTEYEIYYTFATPADFADDPNICQNDSSYHDHDGSTVTEVERHTLPSGTNFSAANVGQSVFFIAPYGETSPLASTFTITNNGHDKTLSINRFGKVDY